MAYFQKTFTFANYIFKNILFQENVIFFVMYQIPYLLRECTNSWWKNMQEILIIIILFIIVNNFNIYILINVLT
jgi:hypothetical protein